MPPDENPNAVNKYPIISLSYHIIPHIISYIIYTHISYRYHIISYRISYIIYTHISYRYHIISYRISYHISYILIYHIVIISYHTAYHIIYHIYSYIISYHIISYHIIKMYSLNCSFPLNVDKTKLKHLEIVGVWSGVCVCVCVCVCVWTVASLLFVFYCCFAAVSLVWTQQNRADPDPSGPPCTMTLILSNVLSWYSVTV